MKDDKPNAPLAYSPEQAAQQLSVGRSTIFELMKTGELAYSKLGQRTCIHADSIREVLISRTVSKGQRG